MIRLRSAFERGLGHRWLGPAVLLFLAVLLGLLVLHATADAIFESALVCLVVGLVVTVRAIVRPRPGVRRPTVRLGRAPPRSDTAHPSPPQTLLVSLSPLRL